MSVVKHVKHMDPNVTKLTAEIGEYGVAIAPILPDYSNINPLQRGSGTCIRIGGRFFIATAGHVIMDRPPKEHFVLTPRLSQWSLKIVGGNVRGGKQGDALDIGWLELTGAAAAKAERSWLDVARLRCGCTGDEGLVVYGAPISDQKTSTHPDGSPHLRANACWWATKGIMEDDLLVSGDKLGGHRMFLKWPRTVEGHDGTYYGYPDAPGISGGGVWATNIGVEPWRADCVQLVGIQYAWEQRAVHGRYLKAMQIQTWLQMVRDDLPELRGEIDPLLAAPNLPMPSK